MKKSIFSLILCLLLSIGVLNSEPTRIKAFANTRFGMTKKEVENNLVYNPDIRIARYVTSPSDPLIIATTYLNISSVRLEFDMWFDFYEDQLYRVRLSTQGRPVGNIKLDAEKIRDNLVSLIKTQYYASPSYIRNVELSEIGYINYPSIHNCYWTHIWNQKDLNDNKIIKIGYYLRNFRDYAAIYIEYPPLAEIVEKKELEKAKEKEAELNTDTNYF